MQMTHIDNMDVIVVGDFFLIGEMIHPRLCQAYINGPIGDWIDQALEVNPPESYDTLKQHPDPRVRLLVARNLRHLEALSYDRDLAVSNLAKRFNAIICSPSEVEEMRRMVG